MANKGLGKGLEALIPGIAQEPEEQTIQEVSISELRPNPYQPRKDFQVQALEELAESMLHVGVVQPLIVRKSIRGYEIVAGERRYRAAKFASMDKLPVIVRECNDDQMMEIGLVENLQREDLNPMEVATAYQKLMDHFSLTQEQLADRVGKSRPHVANFLRLLHLPPDIQLDVSRGTISMGHARALLGVKQPELQAELVKKIKKDNLSVRECEEWIQRLNHNQQNKQASKKKTSSATSPIHRQYEDLLQQTFHTPVKIRQGKHKGKIEIEYFSEKELERLIELLHQESLLEG